jgi:hypothetical protein
MKATYQCQWCENQGGPGSDTPEACLNHEAECDSNPASRSCATCQHYDWPATREQDAKWGHYEDDGEWVSDLGCHAYNDQQWRRACAKWEKK